jgi:UDP-3-O-[3-hydroxymyristoyl] glucosamine N-acyltransferase
MRDVAARQTVAGSPATDIKKFFRSVATIQKLANKEINL